MDPIIHNRNGDCPPGCYECANLSPNLQQDNNATHYTVGDFFHAIVTIILLPIYILLTFPSAQFLNDLDWPQIRDVAEKLWILSWIARDFGTGPFMWWCPSETTNILVSLYFMWMRERMAEEARILGELGEQGLDNDLE